MLRAGEALRGDPVPSNENPLDSLPRGFVPADGTMEFAVSCLGSTIAKTLKKFNVDLTLNRQTENMSRNMNMIAQNYCIITARFEGIYYTLFVPFPERVIRRRHRRRRRASPRVA